MLRNIALCVSIRAGLNNSYQRAALHTAAIDNAARKGTREKARKKKVKVEVKKLEFIPHNQREYNKLIVKRENLHVDDSWKAIPKDENYVGKYFRWRVYSFADAIQAHRETHDPSMYNEPRANVVAHIELNMRAEKATRNIDEFRNIVMIDHTFDHGSERSILVLAKGAEYHQEAQAAGAALYGGSELIKDVQSGELNLKDYDYILAHPNILPELVTLRGLLKKKFPNPKSGTLGVNITEMVDKFKNGIQYAVEQNEHQKDFGVITTVIGKLNMDTEYLEKNLKCILQDINSFRPKRSGHFITRVLIKSLPSPEKLKIDPFVYVNEEYVKGDSKKSQKMEEADPEASESVQKERVAVQ